MDKELHLLLSVSKVEGSLREFLDDIGTVFRVFDQQDSGHLSYGVELEGRRWFVKHGDKPELVQYLKQAEQMHRRLAHPCLPALRHSFETKSGYVLVYDWVNGEVLNSPGFPGKEGRNRPESAHYRFRSLSVEEIVRALSAVYGLHVFLEEKGFVAVDFYDGSMIYDFEAGRLHCCDLDLYHEGPFTLQMDRNFGSSRFMAPEEFVRGSVIDQRTNVYTMGAAAFVFIADGSREKVAWRASAGLYEVAMKAVSPEREERYPSVSAFCEAWNKAKQ